MDWPALLLGATALHAGFQLTVSIVVYPALAATPTEAWATVHDHHSRRIAPLVGLVYVVALAACAGALLGEPSVAVVVSAAATLAAMGVTAALAAPLHGRLGRTGPDPVLLGRLLGVDRLRAAATVAALAAALVAVVNQVVG